MKISYKTILEINVVISRSTPKGVSLDTLMKLIDFKDSINNSVEKYKKIFKEIMLEFKVAEKNGQFDWTDHEDSEKISEKVLQLFEIEVSINDCNFMPPTEFVKMLDGYSLGDISFLKKYLVV